MEIKRISENKKQFLDLLLLADEQESMIDQYLERGDLLSLSQPPWNLKKSENVERALSSLPMQIPV